MVILCSKCFNSVFNSQAPLVACGNSVEVNISSNVTVFAGQQQTELVSSIVKSTTMSSTNASTSAPSTTDTVVLPVTVIPYQAIVSGNKITVFVLSSSKETQLSSSSPSVTASSSSKLQPLLRMCIDHPLCTMTTNNDNVQYNISCYDAHVDLAIGGKIYSSESCAVSH